VGGDLGAKFGHFSLMFRVAFCLFACHLCVSVTDAVGVFEVSVVKFFGELSPVFFLLFCEDVKKTHGARLFVPFQVGFGAVRVVADTNVLGC
jgi:hypothetical protein